MGQSTKDWSERVMKYVDEDKFQMGARSAVAEKQTANVNKAIPNENEQQEQQEQQRDGDGAGTFLLAVLGGVSFVVLLSSRSGTTALYFSSPPLWRVGLGRGAEGLHKQHQEKVLGQNKFLSMQHNATVKGIDTANIKPPKKIYHWSLVHLLLGRDTPLSSVCHDSFGFIKYIQERTETENT